jgi:hypothetical protein
MAIRKARHHFTRRGWARSNLNRTAEAKNDFAAAKAIDSNVAETYASYGLK